MNGYTEMEACVRPISSCRERGSASYGGASSLDERLVYSRSVLLVLLPACKRLSVRLQAMKLHECLRGLHLCHSSLEMLNVLAMKQRIFSCCSHRLFYFWLHHTNTFQRLSTLTLDHHWSSVPIAIPSILYFIVHSNWFLVQPILGAQHSASTSDKLMVSMSR